MIYSVSFIFLLQLVKELEKKNMDSKREAKTLEITGCKEYLRGNFINAKSL